MSIHCIYDIDKLSQIRHYVGIVVHVMKKKSIDFSIYQIVIDNKEELDIKLFESLEAVDTKTSEIGTEKDKEILSFIRIETATRDSRYVSFGFLKGDKFPYSPKIIDTSTPDLKEKDNPRPPEGIEPDEQVFVLIDTLTKRLYISDQTEKAYFLNYLRQNIGTKEILLKPILSEENFIDCIKEVDKLSFTLVPNLLNTDETTLSGKLSQDILGFGSSYARVELGYRKSKITDNLKTIFRNMVLGKDNFKEITITGRDSNGFENTFNAKHVVSKVKISVETEGKTMLLENQLVFNQLIDKLDKHEGLKNN
jgi:hypothetical protein